MDNDQYKNLDAQVIEEAAEWYAKIQSDQVTMEDLDALTYWLSSNPDHAKAYEKLHDVAVNLDGLTRADIEYKNTDSVTIQPVFEGTTEIAARSWFHDYKTIWAGLVAATFFIFAFLPFFLQDAQTPVGEPIIYQALDTPRKSLFLEDGSQIDINIDSQVEFAINAETRSAVLQRGEVTFNVAKDDNKPFWVTAGDIRIEVTGTIFNVMRHKSDVIITVTEGTVNVVSLTETNSDDHRQLTAGKQLRHSEGRALGFALDVNADDVLSWHDGQLIYEEVSLEVVAQDINRYFGVDVMLDSSVRALKFSGILYTDDLQTVLELLENSLSVKVLKTDQVVKIYR
ncbi:FecR family protein [Kordiimonas laminariae]|uniref:FecR family protein n=1 Tax=Kordiimonas laminariae TaxID=2917717 RepID=UPI001FF27C6D|nr:FecR domain-containing protein [Kordiimonas laminariae]MCK0070738.1 FecR domain-containing protein [Kordiimonas laminariae]